MPPSMLALLFLAAPPSSPANVGATGLRLATPRPSAALDIDAELSRPGVGLLAVELFATWCRPCMDAVPRWKALHDRYRSEGLRFVVVSVRDGDGNCEVPGWSPDRIVCDESGALAERLRARKLPASFLWDWQGDLLVDREHVDAAEPAIERWMKTRPRVEVEALKPPFGLGGSRSGIAEAVRLALLREGRLLVVATEAERVKLREILRRSLALSADEERACELGREVTPNSLLRASLTPAPEPRLYVKLYSAEQGCLLAAASEPWRRGEAPAVAFAAVRSLLGSMRRSAVQPGEDAALAGLGDYETILAYARQESEASAQAEAERQRFEATEARVAEALSAEQQARAEALDRAWMAVRVAAVTSALPIEERALLVEKFLRDFPEESPHRETAARYLARLRAEEEPNRAPPGMVEVPAGTYRIGDKTVNRPVVWIDRTEVTVKAYVACMDDGACTAPYTGPGCNWVAEGRGDHPINCVDFSQASAFCAHHGKRVPSGLEWEQAARDLDGRRYPWGQAEPTCDRAVIAGCGDGTSPVGRRPLGASPAGAEDMVGNVAEWTTDHNSAKRTFRMYRGGSFRSPKSELVPAHRPRSLEDVRFPSVGFRCARSPD